MASLFHPVIIRYTLGDGSTRAPDDRRVTKDTPGAVRKKRKATKWYGQYVDAGGIERRVPLSANKTVAGQMLNELVRKAELGKVGIVDPFAEHQKTPLAKHLDDFEAFLSHKGSSERHAAQTARRARRILDACGFVFIRDLSASGVQQHVAALQQGDEENEGVGVATANYYLRDVNRSAAGWSMIGAPATIRSAVCRDRMPGPTCATPDARCPSNISPRSCKPPRTANAVFAV